MGFNSWPVRSIPSELQAQYLRDGLWTDQTLCELLSPHLDRSPIPFIVWSDTRPERTTIGDVFDRARAFALWLVEHTHSIDDVVAFQLPNCVEAAIVFWGALLAGMPVVPIVHTYRTRELSHILHEIDPAVFVVMSSDHPRHDLSMSALAAQKSAGRVPHFITVGERRPGTARFDDLISGPGIAHPRSADAQNPALVAYTSGTTAHVKGVIHTHRTIVAEINQLQMLPQPDPRPVLVGSPIGHVAGMTAALCDAVVRKKAIHLTDRWQPEEILAILRGGNVCLRGGAAYFLASLLDSPQFRDEDVDLMRYVRIGGSSIPSSLIERALDLGIVPMRMYGSTEHPSATSCVEGDLTTAIWSDGVPLRGVELSIRSPDGVDVAQGVPGEIFTRGPDLAVGYIDADMTSSRFTNDGWYATGDVGVLNSSLQLAVVDRISDLIIRGGENISPVEVEQCLMRYPAIAEVAVIGVADPKFGERTVAVLRTSPGSHEVTLTEIQQHLSSEGLGKQKWPESLLTIGDFPRTPSGKIHKAQLRAMFPASQSSLQDPGQRTGGEGSYQ